MAVSTYLQGSVSYRNDPAVTDVQTIIDNLMTLALAASPVWTSSGAGQLSSPADSDGRKMQLQFTRVSATRLQVVATDGQGRTLTRRADIAAGGSSVDYYLGQFHCILDWLNGATSEGLHMVMIDETPESQISHNRWLNIRGSRDSAGTSLGLMIVGYWAQVDSTNAFVEKSATHLHVQSVNRFVNTGGGFMLTRTAGGSNVLYPAIIMGDSTANVWKIRGKLFQYLLCNAFVFSEGTEFTVPLDDSTTGTFKVIHLAVNNGASDHIRVAVRKS